jgi:hypothetical protein
VLGHRSLSHRRAAVAAAATVAALGASLLVVGPAQALGAPGSLRESERNASTHVLSWSAVRKATSYEVQVDSSGSFDSPDYSATTVNTQLVPNRLLPIGDTSWRVRALFGSTRSAWSQSSFAVSPVATPVPLSPANDADLAQPSKPPLLTWGGVQGATQYTVQVDSEPDMIGAKSYTTRSTSLVVPDPLTVGDWYWQVTASKGSGINSLPSTISHFHVDALSAPVITAPADNITLSQVEDVVLDWEPVLGATTYDLQVSTDSDFNTIALSATNLRSTRYSPATTLNNDQFWWRVRAVDPAGQQTPWTSTLYGFKRVWPEQPVAVYPQGSTGSPAAINGTKAFYQWTPVKHATRYQLQVSTDINFSPAVTDTCTTAQTTYTPRATGDCSFPTDSTPLFWHVRPLDLPYPSGGLPGIFSTTQEFTYTPPAPPSGTWDPSALVTGLKIGIDGTGATTDGQGCTGTSPDDVCAGVPSTPVLSWDPVPGANFYYVYYGQDGNFTTTEIPAIPKTANTIFQLNTSNSKSALPDSQAGTAYYWHVMPCMDNAHCGPNPVSSANVLPDTRSFRKASPAVVGLSNTNPNSSEITFSWTDYYNTNVGTAWNGEDSNQTAKQYRIEVDNDESFGSPIDTQLVDQATYTEWSKLYPDGQYWWRVQAIDDQGQGLTWSAPQTFTKVSPKVSLTSPVGSAHVSGTTPFRWGAAPFAGSYNIEVYKNDDLAFSPGNRVVTATVKTTAYVPTTPLPASSSAYVWRVRRLDGSNNPGPWSTTGRFFSNGATASLVRPATGVWVPAYRSLFEWTEVPGAATYQVVFTGDSRATYTTPATAYAPLSRLGDGSYQWHVVALDPAGKVLGSSATRSFRVDGTPPKVVSVTPNPLKPKSTIKVVFSERVHGISKKSLQLYLKVHHKKVRIKGVVATAKKGKVATFNPRGRLKPGNYLVLFVSSRIKDRAGNTLAPSSVAPALKTIVIH